jgi:hypothetical protein
VPAPSARLCSVCYLHLNCSWGSVRPVRRENATDRASICLWPVSAGRITLSRSLASCPCYHPSGASMTNMSGVIQQLKKERVRLEDQLHRITAALTAFGRVYIHGTGTKAVAGRKRGTMSAAARKKISLAQKARRAKQRTAKPKRTLSAAGRKRIAVAQRARWARAKRAGSA